MTQRMPFYDLRDWWLSNARFAEIVDPTNSKNFFPSSEDPSSDIPYARYTVRDYQHPNTYWQKRQDAVVVLHTWTVEESTEAINIVKSMSHEDESAELLNRWLRANNREINFRFQYIRFLYGGEMEPFGELGAAVLRPFTVLMEYVDAA